MTSAGASLDLGATALSGAVAFRVWAPRCRTVEVVVEGRDPVGMTRGADAVFEATLAGLEAGARYRYRLDGERLRPDPRSRWQPEGVHGPSVVVDPTRFAWTDGGFRGHRTEDLVLYEVHVGTFTTEGTFEAIIPRLDTLVDLGVTAIELMPVGEFPGARNWGYDGVHYFAPQSTYGGPRGLRRLVDACHARGLSVVLDVVYNHLGPEGNYLAEYGPYFTDRYPTPWGPAVNFDGDGSAGVRRHVVDSARAWVREFHVDGLRLDAIHAIHDASPVHVLTELTEAARAEARGLGRPAHVMAESHDNDRRIVLPAAAGGLGLDAVWSDDFHHALHVRLTGERGGYYCDFGDPALLPRALAEGFAFQGEPSEFFGRPRGTASADLGGERFVIAVQNHDQVGNRAQGDRLTALVPWPALKAAAALLLGAPALPLVFMGEEYGEPAPFLFFTSFLDAGLSKAVREGRAREFSRFAWQGTIPDPTDPETFARSRVDPALTEAPRHRELRAYYRRWLALRRAHPALGPGDKDRARATLDAGGAVLTLDRSTPAGARVRLVVNLGSEPRPLGPAPGRVLLDSEDPAFAGAGGGAPLAPFQALLFDLTG
jgi:maltooligosyltrehalose trehalohydrolase